MEYAIIDIGGAQQRVSPGDTVMVNRLSTAGDTLAIDRVLMVRTGEKLLVGAPLVDGAEVKATVLGERKGKKVIVFKKKRRKQYRRTKGHRAQLTMLRIDEIRAGH